MDVAGQLIENTYAGVFFGQFGKLIEAVVAPTEGQDSLKNRVFHLGSQVRRDGDVYGDLRVEERLVVDYDVAVSENVDDFRVVNHTA